jgi:hypothetical protein
MAYARYNGNCNLVSWYDCADLHSTTPGVLRLACRWSFSSSLLPAAVSSLATTCCADLCSTTPGTSLAAACWADLHSTTPSVSHLAHHWSFSSSLLPQLARLNLWLSAFLVRHDSLGSAWGFITLWFVNVCQIVPLLVLVFCCVVVLLCCCVVVLLCCCVVVLWCIQTPWSESYPWILSKYVCVCLFVCPPTYYVGVCILLVKLQHKTA